MDHERGREYRKKKFPAKEKDDKQMRILQKVKDNNKSEENHAPQTILLKTRDGENRAVSPQAAIAKSGKDGEPVYLLAPKAPDSIASGLSSLWLNLYRAEVI